MNRDEEMEFDDHDDDQDEEDEDVTLPVQIPPTAAVTGYENSRMKLGGGGGIDSGRKLGGSTSSGLVAPPSRYRECLKNHAVGIGGHAVDGCGEFMPAGEEGTLDALKCAACNCHRNFHRKEVEGSESSSVFHHPSAGPGPPPPAPLQFSPYYRTPPGYLHVAAHRPVQALALPSTSGGHSREDQEDVSGGGGSGGGGGRKRFRTKFSQEQKEKMLAFAERVGWRIQKHDEAAVQQFCMETCVKRHVLKVWMHNNKHTLGKKINSTNMPPCL